MEIDWTSEQSSVLLNPRSPDEHLKSIDTRLPMEGNFKGHLWLATSGSTSRNPGEIKYVALSKQAILASAVAVNEHLQCARDDVWINPLPAFHVGGLGIMARSYLNGAKVYPIEKWNPHAFHELVQNVKATLSALVPAQVYDLIASNLKRPPSLRAIIVGGGHLNEHLIAKAEELGWILLPSYGMTEACSQIATAQFLQSSSLDKNSLKILSHIEVKTSEDGLICLKGNSLLTSYAYLNNNSCELIDPKNNDGWFTTADQGMCLPNSFLKVLGRSSDFVKIGGESVDMLRLEKILDEIKLELGCEQDIALVAVPDSRLGHVIHVAVEGEPSIGSDRAVETFQKKVMPFEKIRKVHIVEKIPRSPLRKLLRAQLVDSLCF